MDKNNIDGLVSEYIKNNLSPKPEEIKLITSRYEEISGILKGDNFQHGSYARFTASTPDTDLDIVWVLPDDIIENIYPSYKSIKKIIDPDILDLTNVIHDLSKKLQTEYEKLNRTVRIKPQSHSVGIYFGETDDEFSIDVVPAIPSGEKNDYGEDIYLVPEIIKLSKINRSERYTSKNPISWIKSDPKGYIKDAQELNDNNEFFRKTAKFVKSWKRSCKEKNELFPLKSFHLELIVNKLFNETGSLGCVDGICSFFAALPDYAGKPQITDKADSSRFIDSYLNDLTSEEKEVADRYMDIAKKAIEKIKHEPDLSTLGELLDGLIKEITETKQSNPANTTRVVDAFSRPYYADNGNR